MQDRKEIDDSDIHGYVHSLSNTERIFLWGMRSKIAVVGRILGNVSEKDLVRALLYVRRMHPLIGCRIIFDENHNALCSTDNVPETILRIVKRKSETQWSDEIRHEHLIPFEPEIGPLIRFVLVYSPQVSELIVFAHHSICDGTAVANLIHDILVCYSNPEKEVQTIQPPILTDYILKDENVSSSRSIEKLAINNYNSQWKQSAHLFTQADFNELYAAYWKKNRYCMILLQLEPEETRNLITRCRKNGVTIVSTMTVAFLAARQEIKGSLPEDQNTVGIPFDLRRHLKKDNIKAFCFFAGDFNLHFSYNQNKSFWKNAQELHTIIWERVKALDTSALNMKSFDPTLVDAIFSYAPYVQKIPKAFNKTENLSAFARDSKNVAFALSQKIRSKHPSMIVTNLGRLDFPETYNDLRLDHIFFAPPANEAVPLICGGVGVNGKLTFSLVFLDKIEEDNPYINEDMIRIRNKVLQYIGFPEKASDRVM